MKLRTITVSDYEQKVKAEELLEKMKIDFSSCAVRYGEWEICFYTKKKVWKEIKKKLVLEKVELFVIF